MEQQDLDHAKETIQQVAYTFGMFLAFLGWAIVFVSIYHAWST